jgi:hypothetical protein
MSFRRGLPTFLRIAFLAVAVLFVLASPAGALTSPGGASITPEKAAPNSEFTITGSGFKPNSPVDATVDGQFAKAGTSDAGGAASIAFNYLGQGVHSARLEGVGTDGKPHGPNTAFAVTNEACVPPPGQTQCSILVRTGRNLLAVAAGGGALAALGLLLILTLGRQGRGAAAMVVVAMLAGSTVWTLARPLPAHAAGTGSIAGKVSNATTSAGVPNVCVLALAGAKFASFVTGADGLYNLSGLDDGDYKVGFVDCSATPTYLGRYFDGKSTIFDADPITVSGGQAVTGKNVALTQGGVLSGVVTETPGGAPVRFACIWAGATADAMNCVGQTRSAGAYYSSPITTAGQYIVAFADFDTHATKYFGDKNDPASSTKATVTVGATTPDVGGALPLAAKITGKVTDAASGAAPTRDVCVADYSSDQATLMSSFADQDGNFDLGQLPPGDHKVKFTDCGGASGTAYTSQFFQGKADLATANPVALTVGQAKPGVNACMSPTSANPTCTATATTVTTATTATTTPGATTTTTAANTPPPSSSPAAVSAGTVTVGGSLTVAGGGFAPGSTVGAFVFSTPVKVGQAVADGAGNVSFSVTIPATLTAGVHTLQLQGVDPQGGSRVLSATITVVGRQAPAVTGTDAGVSALLGAAFVFGGALLVRWGRRKRRSYYSLI